MSNFSNAARETAQDARDAIKESGPAAANASGDLQADLKALREDVAKLANALETRVHAGDGLSPRCPYEATRLSMLWPVIQLM